MNESNWETLAANEVIASRSGNPLPGLHMPTMQAQEIIKVIETRLPTSPKEMHSSEGYQCQRLRPNSEWQTGNMRIKISVTVEFLPEQ